MIEEFKTRHEDRYEENHRSELEQPLHICFDYRAIAKNARFFLALPVKLDAIPQIIAVSSKPTEGDAHKRPWRERNARQVGTLGSIQHSSCVVNRAPSRRASQSGIES